jgi:Sel1 repeat-containing protein
MRSLLRASLLVVAFNLVGFGASFAQSQPTAGTNEYFFSDPPPAPQTDKPSMSLYDFLVTGDVSPRGANASTVDPDNLIDEGFAFMKGAAGHPRDPKEGAYWLKRAIAPALDQAGKNRAWAITSLGLSLAQGDDPKSGLPVARQLWELAAAMGDPTAMCNLGYITENGTGGVKADRKKAIAWYEKAKAAGCAGAGDAIARLNR